MEIDDLFATCNLNHTKSIVGGAYGKYMWENIDHKANHKLTKCTRGKKQKNQIVLFTGFG